jgi:hypothetical protein
VIEFEPRAAVDLGHGASGHVVHAAFLDHVRRLDPSLAEKLHVRSQRKPFTVSPIFERPGRGGAGYWFRLTTRRVVRSPDQPCVDFAGRHKWNSTTSGLLPMKCSSTHVWIRM